MCLLPTGKSDTGLPRQDSIAKVTHACPSPSPKEVNKCGTQLSLRVALDHESAAAQEGMRLFPALPHSWHTSAVHAKAAFPHKQHRRVQGPSAPKLIR